MQPRSSRFVPVTYRPSRGDVGDRRGGGSRVPDPDTAVAADRRQAVAVGTEGNPPDGTVVAAEGQGFLAGGGVPDLHRVVLAGRGQAAAVGAEGDAADRVGVAAEDVQLLTGGGIPEPHDLVIAGRDQASPVGA